MYFLDTEIPYDAYIAMQVEKNDILGASSLEMRKSGGLGGGGMYLYPSK